MFQPRAAQTLEIDQYRRTSTLITIEGVIAMLCSTTGRWLIDDMMMYMTCASG